MMDPLEFFLLVIVFIYLGVFSTHILWKTKRLESQLKKYYYGIAFFVAMFLICRILFLTNDLVYYQTGDVSQKQGIYYIIGSFFATIATFGIMFVVEKYVYHKLHYVPSAIILSMAAMILILPKWNGTNLVTIYTTVSSALAAILPLLYLIVGLQVAGKPRTKSFILATALVIFFLANLLNTGTLKDIFPIFKILSPITILIGLGLFHYGLLIFKS